MTSPSVLATSGGGRWMSGSTVRGTWDIMSLCYSTILLCLCSVFHLYVTLERPEKRSYTTKLGDDFSRVAHFLLFPEYLPSMAFIRLQSAYTIYWKMEDIKV